MDNGLIFPYRYWIMAGDGEGEASRMMVSGLSDEVMRSGENVLS